MAGIFCAGSRTVGSYSVSNFFLGRTGLIINKSTCYVRTSGFSDLIQALLTWYESDEWPADSHCQSIKGTLCPSPVSLGTARLFYYSLQGCQWKETAAGFRISSATGGCGLTSEEVVACRHPPRNAERMRGPKLGCLLRGRTQFRRGPRKREGQDQREKAKETNF